MEVNKKVKFSKMNIGEKFIYSKIYSKKIVIELAGKIYQSSNKAKPKKLFIWERTERGIEVTRIK